MFFCFFLIELDACYNGANNGFFYRGQVSVTERGPCSNWNDMEQLDYFKLYDYVGLDNTNYCRNTVVFQLESKPWCISAGVKTLCGVPKCIGI